MLQAAEKPQVDSQATELGCGDCGATLSIPEGQRTTVCPYCDAPTVVERPATMDRPAPEFVIGFELDQPQALGAVRKWVTSRSWFAHSGLRKAPLDKVRGLYVPGYLFGATATANYSVDIGENYTETYTTTVNGKTVTRTRRKTEWRNLTGTYDAYVRDRVVTASKGLHNHELEAVEPFDLGALKPFAATMIAGWPAEESSLGTNECHQLGCQEAVDHIHDRLDEFMPGDKHRNLQADVALPHTHQVPILLPVWIFAARYHPEKPPIHIVVNGQTGKVGGLVPKSWIKISLAVVLGLGLLGAIVWWFMAQSSGGSF